MKKWTYLVAACMMAGTTPVLTGCVDTDEPAGIQQLRGAKAALLNAKAEVERAKVATEQANAAYINACAAEKQALADKAAAEARMQEIQNALQEATNEIEIQKLQLELEKAQAEWENAKAEMDEKREAAALAHQQAMAQAQFAYETLLKQIEIAKAVGLTDLQLATVDNLEQVLDNAYDALYGTGGAQEAYWNAQELLYTAQKNKEMGYDTDKNGVASTTPILWEASLKADIAQQQVALDAQNEALKKLQDLAAMDVEATDWAAEIDELATNIATLEKEINEKKAELLRQQSTPEYLALYQAVNGVYSEYSANDPFTPAPGADLIKNGTTQDLAEANQDLVDASTDAKYAFNIADYTASVEVTDVMSAATGIPEGAVKVAGAKDFTWGNSGDATQIPAAAQTVISNYESLINALDAATLKTDNEIAQAQATLAQLKEAEEVQKKVFDGAVEDWKAILDIVQKAQAYAVPTTDLKKVTDEYNKAYDALNTAITNWNTQVAAAYTTAYDEALAEATLDVKVGALNDTRVSNITGFDVATAKTQWQAAVTLDEATDARFTQIVNNNCEGADAAETAEIREAVWAEINNIVNITIADKDWTGIATSEAAALKAATTGFDKDGKLAKAITDATTAVTTAYGKLPDALTAFTNLAANSYAQKLTDAAAKLLKPEVMAGTADKSGKYSVGAWQTSKASDEGYTVYTIGNSKIEDKEIADATVTVYDETYGNTALENASKAAFGVDEHGLPWYVQPSREDMEKGTMMGAAVTYYQAVDARQQKEDVISANDDLLALQTELEKQLAAVEAGLTAQYNEVFATELAAIAAAEKANDEAVAALEEAKAPFADLELEIAEMDAQRAADTSVKDLLTGYVDKYLSDAGVSGSYDPDTFASKMAQAIADKQEDVAKAEQALKEAEVALSKAQEGKFDGVAWFTMKLENAEREYNKAVEDYTKAQDDLAKALEIMADNTAE